MKSVNLQIGREPKVSIIIPTLNEEEGIRKTIESIPQQVKECSEILVVDNMSKDKTVSEAEETGAVVVTLKERGKGLAMRVGAKMAKGEILVFLDGDGTYPSKDIPLFLEKVKQNVLVLGNAVPFIETRKTAGEKMKFLYPSFLLSRFVFSKIGIHLQDPLNGMRAITKKDFERLNLTSNGFEIETEMNIKALSTRIKIAEVPIQISERKGKSKFFFNFKSHLKILHLLFEEKKKIQHTERYFKIE